MHECIEFREKWTDQILGPVPDFQVSAFEAELEGCLECQKFFDEARAVGRIIGDFGESDLVPTGNWDEFEARLRNNLAGSPTRSGSSTRSWLAVAAAAFVAIVGLAYFAPRFMRSVEPPRVATRVIHVDLDPDTIEFLGQSEIFLRAFAKIEASEHLDLEDARMQAELQLAGIRQRQESAAHVPPVRTILEQYESILREIKNLDGATAGDLADIQMRIERKGLIAEMKTYQPQTVLMTSRQGETQ